MPRKQHDDCIFCGNNPCECIDNSKSTAARGAKKTVRRSHNSDKALAKSDEATGLQNKGFSRESIQPEINTALRNLYSILHESSKLEADKILEPSIDIQNRLSDWKSRGR